MAPFFLPLSPGGPSAEDAYSELRAEAEECTGSASRDRRIEEIECRQHGRDTTLRVGESNAANGRTVSAIIQLGRDTYTVHHLCADSEEALAPTVLQRTAVYSVTDFH